MLTRSVFAGLGLAVLAGGAQAADLPAYEAPQAVIPVALPLWTGAYVGAQFGFAVQDDDDNCFTFSDRFGGDEVNNCRDYNAVAFEDAAFGNGDDTSPFAGLHIGYDHQVGNIVFGAVADVNWLFDDDDEDNEDLGTLAPVDLDDFFDPFGQNLTDYATVRPGEADGLDWYGTARVRLGYAAGRFLIYGTGGLAFGGGSSSGGATAYIEEDAELASLGFDDPASFAESCRTSPDPDFTAVCRLGGGDDDDVDVGWTLGAGVEFLATNNFSLGLEYLYVNLGDDDGRTRIVFEDGTSLTFRDDRTSDFHAVSVKGSYRFNFGG